MAITISYRYIKYPCQRPRIRTPPYSIRFSSKAEGKPLAVEQATTPFDPLYDILEVKEPSRDRGFDGMIEVHLNKLSALVVSKSRRELHSPKDECIRLLNYLVSRANTNNLRSILISRFQSDEQLKPLVETMYLRVISNLLSHREWDEVLPTHHRIVGTGSLSLKTIRGVFLILSLYGRQTLPVAKELYNALPTSVTRGLVMSLVPLWKESLADATVVTDYCLLLFSQICETSGLTMQFFSELNQIFDVAESQGVINPNERFLEELNIYIDRRGLNIPRILLHFMIIRSARLGNKGFESFKNIVLRIHNDDSRLSKRKLSLLNSRFWKMAARYHGKREDRLRALMSSLGYSLLPTIEMEFIAHKQRLEDSEKAIKDILKTSEQKKLNSIYYGHYLSLVCKELPDRAFDTLQKLEVSALQNTQDWYDGLMVGFLKQKQYDTVIKIQKSLQLSRRATPLSWNLLTSAFACSGHPLEAVQTLIHMKEKGIHINDLGIVDTILGLLRQGRIRKPPTNRPSFAVLSHVYNNRPLTIDQILDQIKALSRHGIILPQSGLKDIISEMARLSLKYYEFEVFLVTLNKVRKNHITAMRRKKLMLVDPLTSQVVSKILSSKNTIPSTYYFDDSLVTRLVYIGFFRSPLNPWAFVAVLKRLTKAGVEIDEHSVFRAVTLIVRRVFDVNAKGNHKFIRQGLHPAVDLTLLLRYFTMAWKGEVVRLRGPRPKPTPRKIPILRGLRQRLRYLTKHDNITR